MPDTLRVPLVLAAGKTSREWTRAVGRTLGLVLIECAGRARRARDAAPLCSHRVGSCPLCLPT